MLLSKEHWNGEMMKILVRMEQLRDFKSVKEEI